MNFLDQIFYKKFLEEHEVVTYVIHKHWWTLVQAVIKFVALAVLFPLMIMWLYWHIYMGPILAIWIIYITALFLQDFIDWYYDALLVSNSSILSIDWHGFFHSKTKRLDFDTIEGVSAEIKGMIPTFFQFGDLVVSGAHDELKLAMVPHVRDWQKIILTKKSEVEKPVDPTEERLHQLKDALQSLLTVKPESDPISFNIKAHQVMVMKQKEIKKKK